jgi:GNAT superfamily N-acetyltransferase
MSDLIIRPASEADVPVMAALREQSGWQGGGTAERTRLYLRGEHHPQCANPERVAFLASTTDQCVGFIAGHLTTRLDCEGELQWVLVAPHARGGPTATLLWENLRQWFVTQSARRICVNVEPENMPARWFYKRMGAVEASPHWMIWCDVTRL